MFEQMKFQVTRAQLEEARGRAAKEGINLQGDAGDFTVGTILGNVTVRYSFNEAANALTLILIDKPRFLSVGKIQKKVRDAIAKEGIREI